MQYQEMKIKADKASLATAAMRLKADLPPNKRIIMDNAVGSFVFELENNGEDMSTFKDHYVLEEV